MKKRIQLPTHDGSNNYLEQVSGHIYKLKSAIEWLRMGSTPENKPFVDPSGGPMLIEGELVPGTDWRISRLIFKPSIGWLLTLGH